MSHAESPSNFTQNSKHYLTLNLVQNFSSTRNFQFPSSKLYKSSTFLSTQSNPLFSNSKFLFNNIKFCLSAL